MAATAMNRVTRHLLAAGGRDGATDGELLSRFLQHRDGGALTALVRRHGPMVWGVCRRLLRRPHDAEEAFQATFLVLVQKAATLPDREAVGNWLYGVARRTAIRMRAVAAKRAGRERPEAVTPEPAVAEHSVWDDLGAILDKELTQLPDKYRALIVLCDLEDVPRKDAARQLDLPEGTVASRSTAARAMLAKRLARRGVGVTGAVLGAVLPARLAGAGVPPTVVTSTIRAATSVAAGGPAGAISPTATALTTGVTNAMLATNIKIGAAVLLAVGPAVGGIGVGVSLSPNPAAVARPPGATKMEDKAEQDMKDNHQDPKPGRAVLAPPVAVGPPNGNRVPLSPDERVQLARHELGEFKRDMTKWEEKRLDGYVLDYPRCGSCCARIRSGCCC